MALYKGVGPRMTRVCCEVGTHSTPLCTPLGTHSAPTLHPLCTLSAPSVLPLCTQLGSAPYWPCRARVLSPRRRFSRIAVVEARGLAKSATKTVIALSRGSKIKTYRTCAPRWKTSRDGRPARTCRPVCRPRLAEARGRPEPGLALAGRERASERASEYWVTQGHRRGSTVCEQRRARWPKPPSPFPT